MLGVDEIDPEDYNIRSAERTELLVQLKGLFDNAPVSPALWACCQLCDKRRLLGQIEAAKVDPENPELLLGYDNTLDVVPLQCKLLLLRLYCGYAHG